MFIHFPIGNHRSILLDFQRILTRIGAERNSKPDGNLPTVACSYEHPSQFMHSDTIHDKARHSCESGNPEKKLDSGSCPE
jgi:hypothetical protein